MTNVSLVWPPLSVNTEGESDPDVYSIFQTISF